LPNLTHQNPCRNTEPSDFPGRTRFVARAVCNLRFSVVYAVYAVYAGMQGVASSSSGDPITLAIGVIT